MKAVYVREFGPIEAMEIVDLPMPEPGPGQVLVRVKASGVNFAETRMRSGEYGGQTVPFVMGMESAGVVEAVGPGVTAFRPGDRVFGRARGSHAQFVVFEAAHLLPLPERLSFEEGAAIPVGWQTAWHGLITLADVQPGQRVLIEGIASSVGSAALQIARWRGAWVAGTASRDEKVAKALEWGANAAYNYLTDDVPARVRHDTGGHGADVSMLTIGGEQGAKTIAAMGEEGTVLLFGSTGGRTLPLDLNIGARNLRLLSFSITSSRRFVQETMETFKRVALPLFANGLFKPVVDRVLPLERVDEAHRLVAERTHFGKIVLSVP
ncbi:MAG: zinc-binding dehydrogenase [Chloroflexota bacterium]|nr:zinc-binding dehydrogenase [Dehalococcoidia bacterium]MDW8255281.1 zinc-binding dehydrogenase [Chloroflexota bacterium]